MSVSAARSRARAQIVGAPRRGPPSAGCASGSGPAIPEAVRAVYRTYAPLVYGVAFRVLRDVGLSEEATQLTFLRAWQAAADFDTRREFGPWLATIARRVAIDLHRREATRAASPLDAVAPDHPQACHPAGHRNRSGGLGGSPCPRRATRRTARGRAPATLQGARPRADRRPTRRPGGNGKSRSHRAHRRLALELGHAREGNPPTTPGRSQLHEAQR